MVGASGIAPVNSGFADYSVNYFTTGPKLAERGRLERPRAINPGGFQDHLLDHWHTAPDLDSIFVSAALSILSYCLKTDETRTHNPLIIPKYLDLLYESKDGGFTGNRTQNIGSTIQSYCRLTMNPKNGISRQNRTDISGLRIRRTDHYPMET